MRLLSRLDTLKKISKFHVLGNLNYYSKMLTSMPMKLYNIIPICEKWTLLPADAKSNQRRLKVLRLIANCCKKWDDVKSLNGKQMRFSKENKK